MITVLSANFAQVSATQTNANVNGTIKLGQKQVKACAKQNKLR